MTINLLIVPILLRLASAAILSILLLSIIGILHRNNPNKVKKAGLKLLILFTIILILIGTGSLGQWGLLPVALLLAYGGWKELLQCIEVKYDKILSSHLILGLGTVGILGGLGGTITSVSIGLTLSLWLALVLPIWVYRSPPAMYSTLGICFGMALITFPLALLLTLLNHAYGEYSLLVLLVMGNDGFAQGFGLIGGKRPLIPQVSPHKTTLGTMGGFLSCLIIGYVLQFLVPTWELWQLLCISGITSILSLCGDLLASSLKREAGIKDFSHVLAVTGGILDKFDSLLFAIPIYYFIAQYLDHTL